MFKNNNCAINRLSTFFNNEFLVFKLEIKSFIQIKEVKHQEKFQKILQLNNTISAVRLPILGKII